LRLPETIVIMLLLCLLLVTLTPAFGDDLLTVATNNGCGKIAGLIRSAGLEDALKAAQAVTLFAPNDEAVAQIPSDVLAELQKNATLLASVLEFHVVPQVAHAADITNDLLLPTLEAGDAKLRLNVYTSTQTVYHSVFPAITVSHNTTQVVTAEGSAVVKTDLVADNGLVHVIDKVIYPLPVTNLPLTLTFDKELGSLAYLIYQAKLTEALANSPFTIFAPSNAAFDKLPGQVYNDLLMNITRLKEVLFTHVVKGVVFSKGLSNGETLTNLQGTSLSITSGADGVKVNHIKVVRADVPATNGVIHVIDTVIMPK